MMVSKRVLFNLAIFLQIVLLLVGCATQQTIPSTEGAASDRNLGIVTESLSFGKDESGPDGEGGKEFTESQLREIQDKIVAFGEELQQKHKFQILISAVEKDGISLMIRRVGDVEQPISEEEMEQVRQLLFAHVGGAFPLTISTYDCCEGPYIEGEITNIDHENHRILIVNEQEKNGNTDDPVANWAQLTQDGKVRSSSQVEDLTFDDLKVGQQVKAWSTGLFLQSYPGQTSVVKIEIVES